MMMVEKYPLAIERWRKEAKRIGERVEFLRNQKEWSQDKLGRKSKLSQGQISLIERGRLSIRTALYVVTQLEKALGVPVGILGLPEKEFKFYALKK